ncbi:MAG: hypothetical protein M4D80_15380 [Myxococcota bacterium]|nr:hypothetical protein [Myxococcota bacterium]
MATHRYWLVFVMLVGCSGDAPDRSDAGMDAPPTEADPEQSGSRLKRRGHDIDGTKALDRIFDSARGETCLPRSWADGNSYCTPFENMGYVVSTDASCTTKVGFGYRGCMPAGPDYYAEYLDSECGEYAVKKVFSRGPERSATQYYRVLSDGTCDGPVTLSPEEKLYTLGPEVPASALARLTETVAAGTHRLRQAYVESEDGLRFATHVVDTSRAFECMWQGDLESKSWACIPGGAAYAGHYADASCSKRAAALPAGNCPVPAYVMHNDKPGCRAPSYSIYETGAALGTVIHDDVGGVCTMHDLGSDVRVVAAGAPVDIATPTRTLSGASARVKRINATAEGDVFWMSSLRDEERQIDCVLAKATDGVTRCLPIGNYVQHYFRDAACTIPVDIARVYRGAAGCELLPKPTFANSWIAATSSCDVRQQIHLIGAEVTAPLYANYGECQPMSSPTVTFYELGPIVPPEDFAAAVPITEL